MMNLYRWDNLMTDANYPACSWLSSNNEDDFCEFDLCVMIDCSAQPASFEQRYAAQSPCASPLNANSGFQVKTLGATRSKCRKSSSFLSRVLSTFFFSKWVTFKKLFKSKHYFLVSLKYVSSYEVTFFLSQVDSFSLSPIAMRFLCTKYMSQVEMN